MSMKNCKASAKQITDSRRLFQNQYAHLNDFGGYDGVVLAPIISRKVFAGGRQQESLRSLGQFEWIERKAKALQKNIWKNRKELWPEGVPENPVQLLDPSIAIQFIGYEYDLSEYLGEFTGIGANSEIAGVIDRADKRVSISRRLRYKTRRFTAAHELGHALLHTEAVMHRDRPIDGSAKTNEPREPMELEADKFASYFLMPERLLRERFRINFGISGVFFLNDDTAFALDPANPEALINGCKSPRDLSRILANTGQYNGRNVYSLATQFGVSVEAMAIRIEELELVKIHHGR